MLVSTEKLALYSCLGRQMTQLHDVLHYLPVYFDHSGFPLTLEAVGGTAIWHTPNTCLSILITVTLLYCYLRLQMTQLHDVLWQLPACSNQFLHFRTNTNVLLTLPCLFWSQWLPTTAWGSKHNYMMYSWYSTCLSILITAALYHCLRQQTQLHDVLLILYLPVFSDHSSSLLLHEAANTTTWCIPDTVLTCLFWSQWLSTTAWGSKHNLMMYSWYCTCLSILITVALNHCMRQQTQLHDVFLILYLPVYSDHSGSPPLLEAANTT